MLGLKGLGLADMCSEGVNNYDFTPLSPNINMPVLLTTLHIFLIEPVGRIWGLPWCKNLTRFSLFVSFCLAVRYCLNVFVSFVLHHP